MSDTQSIVNFKFLPNPNVFKLPILNSPLPDSPFGIDSYLTQFYQISLQNKFPVIVALTYFVSVHLINKHVIKPRQIKAALAKDPDFDPNATGAKLPAVPFKLARTQLFKIFVILHNIFLCVYSVWTFIGMIITIHKISHFVVPSLFHDLQQSFYHKKSRREFFWQTICNLENGIWTPATKIHEDQSLKGLSFYSYWFYISKFYEVVDTIIILLKGRPSSLLQSYHHAGAMLSMWAGVRFQSPPIWVFVVFNSFIHSIMYAYYTLSCLHIRVPTVFKQSLTTMQILQFIIGGSLAVAHLFIEYYDLVTGDFKSCIADASQAMALWINVIYLTPLTMLFGAFWIESYIKKSKKATTSSTGTSARSTTKSEKKKL